MKHNVLQEFVRTYPLIHLGFGILGNLLFIAGSACFFSPETKTLGVWLFLSGSVGMLVGRLGEALARGIDHHWRKLDAVRRQDAAANSR